MREEVKAKELFGKEVLDADANRIGRVVDLDFDIQQGIIEQDYDDKIKETFRQLGIETDED